MLDEEHLDLHEVSNLPHALPLKNKQSTFGGSRKELNACITDALTKFQSISG